MSVILTLFADAATVRMYTHTNKSELIHVKTR